MKSIKTFESFARDAFGLSFFNEVTPEEGEKIDTAIYEALDEFQDAYFEMDEPSTHFDPGDKGVRADYWLVNRTVKALNMLDQVEMKNLESINPDVTHTSKIEYKGKFNTWQFPKIYGNFIWYSVKGKDEKASWRRYVDRIWMIGKDDDDLFRAIDAEFPSDGIGRKKGNQLRAAWDSAKQWKDLDALLAEQIPHLKSIGKDVQDHCQREIESWEQAEREAAADGDPNAGLESWR